MACLVGIDIGGTFTDAVVLDDSGTARLLKTPTTTPQAPAVGSCASQRAIPARATTPGAGRPPAQ